MRNVEVYKWIGHFSVAVLKYKDQTQLKEKDFIWLSVLDTGSITAGGTMAAGDQRKKPRDSIFNHTHEAGRGNWTWNKAMNSQEPPLMMYFLQAGCTIKRLHNVPQTALPVEDQVFKCLRP